MLTKKQFEKIEKEIRAIFGEVEETHKELNRIQNHWLLRWFTLRKQGKLIKKSEGLLDKSAALINKLSE